VKRYCSPVVVVGMYGHWQCVVEEVLPLFGPYGWRMPFGLPERIVIRIIGDANKSSAEVVYEDSLCDTAKSDGVSLHRIYGVSSTYTIVTSIANVLKESDQTLPFLTGTGTFHNRTKRPL
jgi:hypothetical protein